MLIVPIAGDHIKTVDNLPYKVLSFTNLKSEGPAVSCETANGSSIEDIQFRDIVFINDRKVKLMKDVEAYNIFEVDGYFEREHHLPQPDESIESDGTTYKISRIKLHVKNQLSKGIIFECREKDSELIRDITLNQISKIKRSLVSRSRFLSYYEDYKDFGKSSSSVVED
jgi:hypothetical protein